MPGQKKILLLPVATRTRSLLYLKFTAAAAAGPATHFFLDRKESGWVKRLGRTTAIWTQAENIRAKTNERLV